MTEPTKKVRRIKQKYEKEWLTLSEITAIGVGQLADGKIGIIISLKKDSPAVRKKIPPVVEGVPVAFQISGEIKAF